ncbi:MAG: FecR domain-containing protein [Devosia sp.]
MRKLLLGALAALVLISGASAASANTVAGSARGVDPQADATAAGVVRTLLVGADIFMGDMLKTGPEGQVEIIFSDNTKLVVGPNSSLEIQSYLLRNDGTASKLALDVLGGTFRFITGNSPHSAYQINTPTGTIAVRGTAFEGFVGEDGIAHLMMLKGSTEMCDKHKKVCKILEAICQVGEIGNGDTTVIGNAADLTKAQRDALRKFFMYAENEAPLDHEFRVPVAYDCMHQQPKLSANPTSTSSGTATEGDDCEGEGG